MLPVYTDRSRRSLRTRPSAPDTAWIPLGATSCRAHTDTSPATHRCRYRRACPSVRTPLGRSSCEWRLLIRKFLWSAGTHVLRQLVVQVDGASLAVRIRLGAGKACRLHALLHRRHVREVLRQHGQPSRVAHRCVDPFGLRLLSFRAELVRRDLEDALVRVVARVRARAVAQRTGQALADLEVREDLPRGAALPENVGR